MVGFSRQNLLVLVGQRPDAHYIIMDQNQLSPYVEQDLFPLFQHTPGAPTSEFRLLVRKVVSERVEFESAFADAVFEETGGHPFLTVNLLTDLFDWLVEQRRPAAALRLTQQDLDEFRSERLKTQAIRKCSEYEFFSRFIREALSDESRVHTPWLYAVYSMMRRLAEDHPDSMRCSMSDFEGIAEDLRIPEQCGYEVDDLLSTAERSNFLCVADGHVRPRIPLMARISRAVNPELRW
jgi:hypothetical protein